MYLKNSKTIVIKIGSSLLIDNNQKIRKKWLYEFSKDIKDLLNKNKKIIIVSSGAIALGCKKLSLNKKNLKLDKSQAVASIGQIELMNLFTEIFLKTKINISQILLTLEDTEQRRRALNAKRTFENLFRLNFVPIVNENDSIATSEIKYGDNDRLASRVAQISGADSLLLLSDVDGLYTNNPKKDKNAELIKEVKSINKNIEHIATKSVNEHGTGGMKTKIDAAKVCQLSGCTMAIANGLPLRPIKKIIDKNQCTWFLTKISKLDARKKWIISSIAPKGELVVDDGAKLALTKGKSLLATGIKKVLGKFNKGDHIKIIDKDYKECARGLSSFTSDEILKIMGHHSNEIASLLGYISKSEVVHKDDMVEV
ncbi:glutamate 5-kinase [Candidatus Pelagibacter sp.]|nr:glutamate 5-kinase [Candidatus Pelagibacter sp.]